jgi:penicillin-binding protein 1A
MALEYEQDHSKKQILQQYQRRLYGNDRGRTAVAAGAARTYFSKPVWKLTLEQSALLAGLPQAPSEYNPLLNPVGAKERRNEVIQKMAKLGYISQHRAIEGYQRPLELHRSNAYSNIREPYFFDYVQNKLIADYGVNTVRKGGLKIYTTLDRSSSRPGVMRSSASFLLTDPAAAVVSIDPHNGHILAMASSGSYKSNQYNLAAQGHRQPGSAFTPRPHRRDQPRRQISYSTYYDSHHLELDLPQRALERLHRENSYAGTSASRRRPCSTSTRCSRSSLDMGPSSSPRWPTRWASPAISTASRRRASAGCESGSRRLRWPTPTRPSPRGDPPPPIAIRRISPDGHVDQPEKPRPSVISSGRLRGEQILHENITGGTGTAAYTGCGGQAGAGTTDNFTDARFVGYQPNQTTAVWPPPAGDPLDDQRARHHRPSGHLPQIWHDYASTRAFPGRSSRRPRHDPLGRSSATIRCRRRPAALRPGAPDRRPEHPRSAAVRAGRPVPAPRRSPPPKPSPPKPSPPAAEAATAACSHACSTAAAYGRNRRRLLDSGSIARLGLYLSSPPAPAPRLVAPDRVTTPTKINSATVNTSARRSRSPP